MPLDTSQLATSVITMVLGGISSWLGVQIIALVKELNSFGTKIQIIDEQIKRLNHSVFGPGGPHQ